MVVLSPYLSLSSVILIDSSTGVLSIRLDVVHSGRAWSSSPACTWHFPLHYLFLYLVSSRCDRNMLAYLL